MNSKADAIKGDVYISSTFVQCQFLIMHVSMIKHPNTDHQIDNRQQDMDKCLTQDRSGSTTQINKGGGDKDQLETKPETDMRQTSWRLSRDTMRGRLNLRET